jgi:hypothetical protein
LPASASQYIGSTQDINLGNTRVVRSAVDAFGELAKVVRGTKKDGSIHSEKKANSMLCKQMQAWLAVHPKLVTQRLDTTLPLSA